MKRLVEGPKPPPERPASPLTAALRSDGNAMPSSSATISFTTGTRLEPPTSRIRLTSDGATCAPCRARRTALLSRCWVSTIIKKWLAWQNTYARAVW